MKILNKDVGQTSVEYIFLIAVIISIMFSAFQLLKEKVLADIGNCSRASTSLICQFENRWIAKTGGGGPCSFPFRCFSIR